MAIVRCSECGKEVSDKAAACIGCGAPIERQASQAGESTAPVKAAADGQGEGASGWVVVTLVIAAMAFTYFGFSAAMKNSAGSESGQPVDQVQVAKEERRKAKRGIEYCESRYKEMNADRQFSPDVLRFHSQTCRKMRDDYRSRWGREA